MACSWGAIGTPRVRIACHWFKSVQRPRYCLFEYVRFSRKSKDYKPFKGPSWYKLSDVAVKPETVKPDGSSSIPGWIELLSVRWLLVCGSMPD